MNRAEYWLLDIVVTRPYPLDILMAANVEEVLNRTNSHHLPCHMLVNVLDQMFRQGYLQSMSWNSDLDIWEPMRNLIISRSVIEAALNEEIELMYGLTAQGGATWEAKLHPNWQKYRNEDVSCESSDIAEITAGSKEMINEYMSLVFPSYLYPLVPIPESITNEQLSPWQATYWKSLPVGYRIRFNYQVIQTELAPSDTFLQRYGLITQWYDKDFFDE